MFEEGQRMMEEGKKMMKEQGKGGEVDEEYGEGWMMKGDEWRAEKDKLAAYAEIAQRPAVSASVRKHCVHTYPPVSHQAITISAILPAQDLARALNEGAPAPPRPPLEPIEQQQLQQDPEVPKTLSELQRMKAYISAFSPIHARIQHSAM
jgi:hypothetical protein